MGEEFYVKGTWGHENKSKNKVSVCETNAHDKALAVAAGEPRSCLKQRRNKQISGYAYPCIQIDIITINIM